MGENESKEKLELNMTDTADHVNWICQIHVIMYLTLEGTSVVDHWNY